MFDSKRVCIIDKTITSEMHGRVDVLALRKGETYSTGTIMPDSTVCVFEHEKGLMWPSVPAYCFETPNAK